METSSHNLDIKLNPTEAYWGHFSFFFIFQNLNFNLVISNFILGNTNINLGNINFILRNTNCNLGNTNFDFDNSNFDFGNNNFSIDNSNIVIGNANLMLDMLLSPPTRPLTILFLYVNHITQTSW